MSNNNKNKIQGSSDGGGGVENSLSPSSTILPKCKSSGNNKQNSSSGGGRGAFYLKFVSLFALILQTTAAVVLTRYATLEGRKSGSKPFLPVVLVAMQEALKLIFSCVLVAWWDYTNVVTALTGLLSVSKPVRSGGGGGGAVYGEDGNDEADIVVFRSSDCGAFLPRLAKNRTPDACTTKKAGLGTHQRYGGGGGSSSSSSGGSFALWRRIQFALKLVHYFTFAHPKEAAKVLLPALLYTLQNNLIYVALNALDATVFQVAYQSKIIVTGVLTVLLIPGRHLSWRRWLALLMLAAGIAATQLGERKETSSSAAAGGEDIKGAKLQQVTEEAMKSTEANLRVAIPAPPMMRGLLAVLGAALCSGAAGVAFELVLKANELSTASKNMVGEKTKAVMLYIADTLPLCSVRRHQEHRSLSQSRSSGDDDDDDDDDSDEENINSSNNAFVSSSSSSPFSASAGTAAASFFKDFDWENASALTGITASVWLRNAQLAFFSLIIATCSVVVYYSQHTPSLSSSSSIPSSLPPVAVTPFDPFQGFTPLVWTVIWIQAAGGLIIAMVIRYADNILKCFATAISIIVCGMCSAFFLDCSPTLLFASGGTVVLMATFLYSLSP